jgi:hypothetical protein
MFLDQTMLEETSLDDWKLYYIAPNQNRYQVMQVIQVFSDQILESAKASVAEK